MTTVVPKLSKTDSVPFKALKPSGAEENSSASFARALKEADSSRAAVRQASEAADNSVRLRSQNGESETSAGASEIGDDLNPSGIGSVSLAGRRVANSGDLESAAKNPGELTEALAGDPANIAGIAAPLASPSAILTATDANVSIDGTLSTQVATVLAPGAMSKAASGELSDPAATSDNTPVSAKSSVPTSAAVFSTSQGSTISGVMDPALFAAPGGVVGIATSFDSSAGAFGSMSAGFAGGPIGFGGASAAVQGAAQSTANTALLHAGRLEASLSGVGSAGPRAAISTSSGAASVASALAAASVVRTTQSPGLSDPAGLSTTVGSITGTLSVPMMSDSGGADLGGSALGTQTGGAGSESGASSGGSRSGNSNAFTVQLANPAEPNGVAASAGAVDFSARSARSVGLGTYATTTTNTNAESVVEVSANQSPALDVNASVTGAAVASDPRAAWRDLRSKWDQPIRANAPKG